MPSAPITKARDPAPVAGVGFVATVPTSARGGAFRTWRGGAEGSPAAGSAVAIASIVVFYGVVKSGPVRGDRGLYPAAGCAVVAALIKSSSRSVLSPRRRAVRVTSEISAPPWPQVLKLLTTRRLFVFPSPTPEICSEHLRTQPSRTREPACRSVFCSPSLALWYNVPAGSARVPQNTPKETPHCI